MYKLELLNGKVMWMNERIIQRIIPNEDGTLTIYHFNDTYMTIKAFSKV